MKAFWLHVALVPIMLATNFVSCLYRSSLIKSSRLLINPWVSWPSDLTMIFLSLGNVVANSGDMSVLGGPYSGRRCK